MSVNFLLQMSTIEHIFYLLGYAEGKFFVQPTQLRASPILDALLLNLAQVLLEYANIAVYLIN